MLKYSCKNCSNLKTRIITMNNIKGISKNHILKAIHAHDIFSLSLDFPFNFTVYKRILKYKECKIIYCSANMLKRDLYVYRDNVDIVPEKYPCLKYI